MNKFIVLTDRWGIKELHNTEEFRWARKATNKSTAIFLKNEKEPIYVKEKVQQIYDLIYGKNETVTDRNQRKEEGE